MSETVVTRDLSVNGFRPEDDPSVYLAASNFLDPADPFDRLLIDLKEKAASDNFPTAADQARMINGIVWGDSSCVRDLIDSHKEVIAAVAYPFRSRGASAEELLGEGSRALTAAAQTYESAGHPAFYDYAITAMHEALRERWPEENWSSFVEGQEHPMTQVYFFAETLEIADTPEKMQMKREQDRARQMVELTPKEMELLAVLHLPGNEISEALKVSDTIVSRRLSSLKNKLHVDTREAVVLAAWKRGIIYDVQALPEHEGFSLQQRQVAMRLSKRNVDIAEELKLSTRQLNRAIAALYKKTGARSRAELMLMAHMNDFEPTEEELNPPDRTFIERLTPLQKDVFQHMICMEDTEVSEHLSTDEHPLSVAALERLAQKAVAELGVNNRTGLILELHRQGMRFNVIELDKPIVEILNSQEIAVIENLDLEYEAIAEDAGLKNPQQVNNIVFRAKKKTGARSRHELALLVEMRDPSEGTALEVDHSNNRWRLAQRLGLKTLDACDVHDLLRDAKEQEREAVLVFYLAETAIKWEEAAETLDVTESAARNRGQRGIQAMRRRLELSRSHSR